MKHIKRFNELSSLGSLIGKGAGLIRNTFSKIPLDLSKKKDTDLGEEILDHINNMPRVYNRSGVKDETTINQSNNNWYYFIDKIFKGSGEKYKVDIIKHLDYKTTNRPEYTVTINKAGITQTQHHDRFSGREIRVRDTVGGNKAKRSYGNANVQSESERLELGGELSKKIYLAAESVWKEVHKNIKDDARGK